MSDHPSLADDQRYIAGALDGDEEALEHVLRSSQEWAYHVAYRVLGREADARDAVQDAFLLTVRALRGDGSPPRNTEGFRPWLRKVVVNAALTQVRRRPLPQSVSVDAVAESLPGSDRDEPGHVTEREETRGQVLQALLALPGTQRGALALREFLDASYEEIAEVLEIPTTAVGTLLFRARAGFRASYDRIAETSRPVDCPDIAPLFSTIIDTQPRPAAWNELEQHLRTCDRCQGELAGQRRARRLYAIIPLGLLPASWDPATDAIAGINSGHAASVPDEDGNVPSSTSPTLPDAAATAVLTAPPPDAMGPEVAGRVPATPAGIVSTAEIAATASAEVAASTAANAAASSAANVTAPGLLAAHAATTAANVAAAHAVTASAAAATTGGVTGSAASVATAGGLAGIATGAKVGFAALAAAVIVGGAMIAGPQLSGGEAPAGVPSPVLALSGSPLPSPNVVPSPSEAAGLGTPSVAAPPSPPSVSTSPSAAQPTAAQPTVVSTPAISTPAVSAPAVPSSVAQPAVTGSPPAPSPAPPP